VGRPKTLFVLVLILNAIIKTGKTYYLNKTLIVSNFHILNMNKAKPNEKSKKKKKKKKKKKIFLFMKKTQMLIQKYRNTEITQFFYNYSNILLS